MQLFMDCAAEDFHRVKDALEEMKVRVAEADMIFEPKSRVPLSGDKRLVVEEMVERFENEDDIQEVFHNADFVDEQ